MPYHHRDVNLVFFKPSVSLDPLRSDRYCDTDGRLASDLVPERTRSARYRCCSRWLHIIAVRGVRASSPFAEEINREVAEDCPADCRTWVFFEGAEIMHSVSGIEGSVIRVLRASLLPFLVAVVDSL